MTLNKKYTLTKNIILWILTFFLFYYWCLLAPDLFYFLLLLLGSQFKSKGTIKFVPHHVLCSRRIQNYLMKRQPKGHTVQDFADKLKRMRLDVYDAYEGDKGAQFMTWLEERWAKL